MTWPLLRSDIYSLSTLTRESPEQGIWEQNPTLQQVQLKLDSVHRCPRFPGNAHPFSLKKEIKACSKLIS